jgi:5-methylcytosine-specific restriction protein A
MQLRDALARIMREYPKARTEPFGKHPLAEFIRQGLRSAVQAAAPGFESLHYASSPGKVKWSDSPWVAVFDPLITETPQNGYYPIYLFTRRLDAVYLSMNQGMTTLKEDLGVATARDVMKIRSAIMLARVRPDVPNRFMDRQIDLQPAKVGSRLELYQAGHAFGPRYAADALPTDAELSLDLVGMLRIYALLRNRNGYDELDLSDAAARTATAPVAHLLEEARTRTLHERIERNRRLSREAKKAHGYACVVCGFDFERHYGPIGRKYIIAHHKTPLAAAAAAGPIRLSAEEDFVVVCANCHAMIHAKGAPAVFEDFVALYRRIHPRPDATNIG